MDGQDQIILCQKSASVLIMVYSSILSMLPMLTYGTVSAYLTIGLPKLLEPNGTGIIIDLHQMSWICKKWFKYFQGVKLFLVTLNQPARVFGLFVSGLISEKIGRKKSLISFSILQILTSVMMFFVKSYPTLMVAMCCCGFSMAMVMIPRKAFLKY